MLEIRTTFDNQALKDRIMEDLDMCEAEFDYISFTVDFKTLDCNGETITFIDIEDGLLWYNANDFLEVEEK